MEQRNEAEDKHAAEVGKTTGKRETDGSTGGVAGDAMQRAAVGRVVHYYYKNDPAPHLAFIACVYSNVLVNLAVFEQDGSFAGGIPSVLRQDAKVVGADGNYWVWPPRV